MAGVSSSFVLHGTENKKQLINSINSIIRQSGTDKEVLIICEKEIDKFRDEIQKSFGKLLRIHWIDAQSTPGKSLNKAFHAASSPFILYMDNRESEITLKLGALELYQLAMHYNPLAGLIYADYELEANGQLKEIHLLKYHVGRVRDNQDFGKVFFLRKEALEKAGFADEKLKFNTLYDLRLKISEQSQLVHLANRYAGSLYRIAAETKGHNVFDYLLASKESQLEAEAVRAVLFRYRAMV